MPANLPTLKFSGGTLVLEGYAGRGVPELGSGVQWVWDSRVRAWRCDAIAYPALRHDPRFLAEHIIDSVPAWQRIT